MKYDKGRYEIRWNGSVKVNLKKLFETKEVQDKLKLLKKMLNKEKYRSNYGNGKYKGI
jgi:hypothetical protein